MNEKYIFSMNFHENSTKCYVHIPSPKTTSYDSKDSVCWRYILVERNEKKTPK